MNTDRFKPFEQKGRILAIDAKQDVDWSKVKDIDAVMIQLGGIDGDSEANFWLSNNRTVHLHGANQAGIPVILRFNIASRYYHQKGMTAAQVEGINPLTDPVFAAIIGACTQYDVAAIDLFYWDWTGWPPGTDEESAWVRIVTNTWIDGILLLIGMDQIPEVPIIFETWPGFITKWDKDGQPSEFHQGLINRLDRIYLNEVVPDPLFPETPTAATFFLDAAFSFPHEGTDKYQWVQGIDNRPIFWGFSKGRFRLDCLGGGTGELILSNYLRQYFKDWLGVTVTPPPPDNPPPPPVGEVTLKNILDKIDALEISFGAKLEAIKTDIDDIKEKAEAAHEFTAWLEPRLKSFIK